MKYGFYVYLAIQILKRILPSLKKKAQETPNQIDDTTIALVELAIELYETGKIPMERVNLLRAKTDV